MASEFDDRRSRRDYAPRYDDDPDLRPWRPKVAPGKMSRSAAVYSRVYRAATNAGPIVADPTRLDAASRSRGQGLPDDLRAELEQSLGADLSGVRVHTDGSSADAARSIHARAYTTGKDIHFAPSSYDPESDAGRRLIAHEVAHTVQQAGAPAVQAKLEVSQAGDALEIEADRFADAFVAKGRDKAPLPTVQRRETPTSVLRKPAEPATSSAETQPRARANADAGDPQRAVLEVPRWFVQAISELPRWTQAVNAVDPCAARLALNSVVATARRMRVATDAAQLQVEGAEHPPRANSGDARQNVQAARQSLISLAHNGLVQLSPNTFRGQWLGGDAPTPTPGAPVDLLLGNAGDATLRALHAAEAMNALLGGDAANAGQEQRRAAAAIAARLDSGEGEQTLLRAILASRGQSAAAPAPRSSRGVDDILVETAGDALLGPAGHVLAGDWYRSSGAKQLAHDIALSIDWSGRFAAEVFGEAWAQVEEHWQEIVATTLGFIAVEALAAVLVASPHPAARMAGLALQAALLAVFVLGAFEELVIGIGALVEWLGLCASAKGDPKKVEAAAHKFAEVVFHATMALVSAAGGMLIKGLHNKLRARRAKDGTGAKHVPEGDSPEQHGGRKSSGDESADPHTSTKTEDGNGLDISPPAEIPGLGRPGNFASHRFLFEHYTKHAGEFRGAFGSPEAYAHGAQEVMRSGIPVDYLYRGETRRGFVQLMGTSRKGQAKFAFVGTNQRGFITTFHTKSGKEFWKLLNGNPQLKNIVPAQ